MGTQSGISTYLARNIRQLRESRGMTQQQLAAHSGVPRTTCANLESGSGNPTVAVVVQIAAALQVSVEELLSPPRATVKFYAAKDIPARRKGLVSVRKLLPDAVPGFQIDRMELPPGSSMGGVPHTPGTREYLTCESGEIELSAAGERWRLAAGDVLVFRGDQPHGYKNPGRVTAIAYSVIALGPLSGAMD